MMSLYDQSMRSPLPLIETMDVFNIMHAACLAITSLRFIADIYLHLLFLRYGIAH